MTHAPPPTQDDLAAGRELDAEVATKVFGWCDCVWDGWSWLGTLPGGTERWPIPAYSTDISAAWQVLDEMVWRVGTATIRLDMEDYGRGAGTSPGGAERAVWVTIGEHTAFGPICEAICKAALAAVSAMAIPPA